MDDIDSVTMAGTWKQDIVNNAVFTDSSGNIKENNTEPNKQIPILLLGNKTDKVSICLCIVMLVHITPFFIGLEVRLCWIFKFKFILLNQLQYQKTDEGAVDSEEMTNLESVRVLEGVALQHGFVGR